LGWKGKEFFRNLGWVFFTKGKERVLGKKFPFNCLKKTTPSFPQKRAPSFKFGLFKYVGWKGKGNLKSFNFNFP